MHVGIKVGATRKRRTDAHAVTGASFYDSRGCFVFADIAVFEARDRYFARTGFMQRIDIGLRKNSALAEQPA